jgi:uncharacterized protein YciI
MRFTSILLLFAFASSYGQRQTYTFVFLHKKDSAEVLPKEQVTKIMEGHMANIDRLAKEGKLLVAGPFDGGGGIFILKTTSVSEAKEWLSTDPGVQANRWNVEVLPYTPRAGSVCVAKEPYEMVSYHFVRFKKTITSGSKNEDQILKRHDDYLNSLEKKETLVTTGIFGSNENIFIFKNDLTDEILATDSAIKDGLITPVFKILWIAKGSFCEK